MSLKSKILGQHHQKKSAVFSQIFAVANVILILYNKKEEDTVLETILSVLYVLLYLSNKKFQTLQQ